MELQILITLYPALFSIHRKGTDDYETTLFEFSIQPCKFRCVQSLLDLEKVISFVWIPQWLENCNHSYWYDILCCKSLALKLSRNFNGLQRRLLHVHVSLNSYKVFFSLLFFIKQIPVFPKILHQSCCFFSHEHTSAVS